MNNRTQFRSEQTSAHKCNFKHLDPAALDALADIVDRLRRSKVSGCFAAQDDWLEALEFPAPVPLLHDPAQALDDKNAVDRFSIALDSLKLAITALSAIQEHILPQKETCESRLASLRIRGGLSSLSDDVLSIILQHASEEENSALSIALGLSHVCRRFRELTLRMPTLWCNIWSYLDIDLVSMLCDRMTKPIAEITFHGVLFIVMARETHQLQAPFLSRIFIRGSRSTLEKPPLEDSLHYYSTWSMPRLTAFFVENFVPIPLLSATSVTEFRLLLKYKRAGDSSEIRTGESLSSLFLFLASCPALKIVTMTIEAFKEFTGFSTSNFADLPTVETLELSFTDCQGSILKTFFRNARFPNVSTMELRVYGWWRDSGRASVQDGLDAVFRNSHTFDRLTHLTLATGSLNQEIPL
ncbi:hypothetical protein SCHPADRAFT_943957 [Schizopora paradoxa]|uniref:F-box domain-containing protein n=1 Tax=Schizopora paradoxa TaxID=27342 RepID=A0A0H2RC44_9AGAM|nr:hypothetical protein SCHPADRAFT_943957 [Schizopora paradoxa]